MSGADTQAQTSIAVCPDCGNARWLDASLKAGADKLASILAENERLREALRVAFAAADDLLAPICAEAGRVLLELPDENMTEHLPVLPAKLFAALYDVTHPDILVALSKPEGK